MFAFAAGDAESLGGLFALGPFTPLASAAIVGTMLNAALSVHARNGFWTQNQGYEYVLQIRLGAVGFPAPFSLGRPPPTRLTPRTRREWMEALQCHGLTYRFGSHTAVDTIDLSVRPGEAFGLLGPNGARKTTTIRVVTTLLPVEPGRVRIFGLDAARDRMRVRRLLGYLPQLLSADPALIGILGASALPGRLAR